MTVAIMLRRSARLFRLAEKLSGKDNRKALRAYMESYRLREGAGVRNRQNGVCLLKAARHLEFLTNDVQVRWKRATLIRAMETLQEEDSLVLLADVFTELGTTYLPRWSNDIDQDYLTGAAESLVACYLYRIAGVETPQFVQALQSLATCLQRLGRDGWLERYEQALEMSRRVNGPVCWETFQLARSVWLSLPEGANRKTSAAQEMWEASPYQGETLAVTRWWSKHLRPLNGQPEAQVQQFEQALALRICQEMNRWRHSIMISREPAYAVLHAMKDVNMAWCHRRVPWNSGTEITPGQAIARVADKETIIYRKPGKWRFKIWPPC